MFKVNLTPETDKPMYTQGQPIPINYRFEVLLEMASLQYWGVITTLTYQKNSIPSFAVPTPIGKLRILVDLRRINHLMRNDYDNHTFPLATMAYVNTHITGKKYLAKLHCTQAYHVRQMTGPLSMQLLGFNFVSTTSHIYA